MFKFTKMAIPDVLLIETEKFNDGRGYFFEHYKESVFKQNGISHPFSQDSLSKSKKGVLRGLHFQKEPFPQGKLVSVLSGSVFDVAVDIRKDSPHFGKWVSAELSEYNNRSIWVPPGFAHGFESLEDNTIILYKTTGEYSKEHERGIVWNDPDLAIAWPINNPILSEKDSKHPAFKDTQPDFAFALQSPEYQQKI